MAIAAASTELLVSAAASLTDAFEQIGAAFARKEKGGVTVRFNFAASGALKQQILAGAPVAVFASAAPREMDELERAKRIEAATRRDFARNRLVLIVPAGSRAGVRDWKDLTGAGIRRIAVASPDGVPAGRYARETLLKRGLWAALQPKLVFGENVRQTLTYVAGGDADAGIVFATDARSEARRVRIAAVAIPGRDHSPIVYPAAVIAGAPNPEAARRFVRFLLSREAQGIFKRWGFSSLTAA
ncbi:MAG: molybdate ABC transporter substrate-binding protein [Cytophagales bacterium]|nr:molybdate ABC transporter substrate-binding protein [Armatimonadota bacterium]